MFGLDPTVTTFLIYLLGMIFIGFTAYRVTNNLSDYILGGRWLLMGLPGAIYAGGLIEAWLAIGLTLGAYLNWKLVAGRLRAQTEYFGDALTLPEYFHNRFGDKTRIIKILSALIFLLFFAVYCGWCSRIRKPIWCSLCGCNLVWCRCYDSLYLYRWLFSGKLDGYHSSYINAFCVNSYACFCADEYWWL